MKIYRIAVAPNFNQLIRGPHPEVGNGLFSLECGQDIGVGQYLPVDETGKQFSLIWPDPFYLHENAHARSCFSHACQFSCKRDAHAT